MRKPGALVFCEELRKSQELEELDEGIRRPPRQISASVAQGNFFNGRRFEGFDGLC
jgi:hypothetical protein